MMGRPMAVYDRAAHLWIGCRLRRLPNRLETDRPTLGVCFGAQMIATAQTADDLRASYLDHGSRAITASRAMIAEWLVGLN